MQGRIRTFWEWLVDRHHDVAAAYSANDTRWLAANLTAQVKRIQPQLNWELGPYCHPDKTLVICPSVRENLTLASRVVASAPELTGWHFLPAKPPKELKRLVMHLPGKAESQVDAEQWAYRLTAYNRMEFFDIEVFTDAVESISDGNLELLTRCLIESLLREAVYLDKIAAVKAIRPGSPRPSEELTAFPDLARHVACLAVLDRR